MTNFTLPELDPFVTLLGAAAFVSGFALVSLQVSNVAFERKGTGRKALGTGEEVMWLALQGDVPDRVRKEIVFLIRVFRGLLIVFISLVAWSCVVPLISASSLSLAPSPSTEVITTVLLATVPQVLLVKLLFAIFWLFMMYGVGRLLHVRLVLANLVQS